MTLLNSLEKCSDSRTATVERRSNLSVDEFAGNYLYPARPVIITDACQGWKALSTWNSDFFKQNFGDRQVILGKGMKYFKSSVKDFIEYARVFADVHTNGGPEDGPYYMRNVIVGKTFPELLGDFAVHPFFMPNWLERWPLCRLFPLAESSSSELFIGPPGARVPRIHRDRHMTHSWLSQVAGEKVFWMVSPEQNELVYQNPENMDHSMVNSMDEPDLEKFPLFANATVYSAVLHPGETVFIPAGWWHTARCLTISISLSGNFVNRSNFLDFREMTTLPAFKGPSRFKKMLNQAVLVAHGLLYTVQDVNLRPRPMRQTPQHQA